MPSYTNFAGRVLSTSAWGPTTLQTATVGQRLDGSSANETLKDDKKVSVLAGGGGQDTYYVAADGTRIVETANGGVDTVNAYTDFVLPDHVEHLYVWNAKTAGFGNAMDNILIAKGTLNLLDGGKGDDVLVDQSASRTRFLFERGDGNDVIIGFNAKGAASDLIKLEGYGYQNFDQVRAAMRQRGNDVLITSRGDQILIKDVLVTDLSASNFLLPIDLSNYHITFREEFDSLSLYNPTTGQGIWKTTFISGSQNSVWTGYSSRSLVSNQELQLYVDPLLGGRGTTPLGLNPFSINDGVLTIHAARTPDAMRSVLWDYNYTSGLLTTQTSHAQTYGYFEIRAQLPSGAGVWPAFWLLPSDRTDPAEIDVFEQIGDQDVHQTVHTGQSGQHVYTSFSTALPTVSDGMHTYGVLWTAETITWYIDGVATGSVPTPADMHDAMYMLVNLAIGGEWAGPPPADFSGADLRIDYIRAYSLNTAPVAPPTPVPEAEPSAPPVAPPTVPPTVEPPVEPAVGTKPQQAWTSPLSNLVHTEGLVLTEASEHPGAADPGAAPTLVAETIGHTSAWVTSSDPALPPGQLGLWTDLGSLAWVQDVYPETQAGSGQIFSHVETPPPISMHAWAW